MLIWSTLFIYSGTTICKLKPALCKVYAEFAVNVPVKQVHSVFVSVLLDAGIGMTRPLFVKDAASLHAGVSGLRTDEVHGVSFLVGIDDLSSIQCFNTVGCATGKASRPLIPQRTPVKNRNGKSSSADSGC